MTRRMTHLEGHEVRDLERVFLRVVEQPPYDNDLSWDAAPDAYVEALQAEQRRDDWMLGFKVAMIVIGATIVVVAVTVAIAVS